MTLHIYHLKACDTCRKAIKALQANGHELSLHDVRADGIPSDKLKDWIKVLGVAVVLNTRSTTWRGLPDADKTDMTDAKAHALILRHPTLMKRPLIQNNTAAPTVGWTKPVQDSLLGG